MLILLYDTRAEIDLLRSPYIDSQMCYEMALILILNT